MHAELSKTELYLFNTGDAAYAYKTLGCHLVERGGEKAYRFAVWAPSACAVSVVGSFNGWNTEAHKMQPVGTSGVWLAHIDADCAGAGCAHEGDLYKYAITTAFGEVIYKQDPYAFFSEHRPNTASRIYELAGYTWHDSAFLGGNAQKDPYTSPMSIYEVHLPSWKSGRTLENLSSELVAYVKDMGYTHIELMPMGEYPLDDSWGYQQTGYYSITSRQGEPKDFMRFVDSAHEAGLGVILDWVPAHFPKDAHSLYRFDGSALYEHPDSRRGEQPQWGTALFDFSRTEVVSFLISNAIFFLKEFHIDALRVDAVSCMLYLDYGKSDGEWLPNKLGGKENLDAIAFLKKLSQAVGRECAGEGKLLFAEESTAFPLVTKPPEAGGLGFNFKWNMGWMNDTLEYFSMDSLFRKQHHDKLTFSMCYAYSENFVLPFSHDEVVHLKNSLIGRMPGEKEHRLRQLRLLYMYQYAFPGKKLLFMGGEFAQEREWAFAGELDWALLQDQSHCDMREFVRALNGFYQKTPALYALDTGWDGFEWISVDDAPHSVAAFIRKAPDGDLVCVYNFTPVGHDSYKLTIMRDAPFKLRCVLSSVDLSERSYAARPATDGEYTVDIKLSPYEGAWFSMV